jgi:hypothetical protein
MHLICEFNYMRLKSLVIWIVYKFLFDQRSEKIVIFLRSYLIAFQYNTVLYRLTQDCIIKFN